MFSFKSIVLIAAAFTIGAESSAVPVAAPLVAPAAVGYAQAIPQNIPPYASQVSVVNRAALVAGPAFAPYVAGPAPYVAGPVAAPAPYFAGPVSAAAPYVAGPAPVLPAPYAAAPYTAALPYAAPFPYSAQLLRAPYGAPAFVR